MSSNIYRGCKGSGNRVTFGGRPRWTVCTGCSGTGVRHVHGPAVVVIHGKPAKRRAA